MTTETVAAPTIEKNAAELVQAIRAGKLEWTTSELLPYILTLAGGAESTARSRAATVARTAAYFLGVSFDDSVQGRYVFGAPAKNADGSLPQVVVKVVEKPVEKIVYKEVPTQSSPGSEELEAPVKFPTQPLPGKANPNYVTPGWYKRMEAALEAGKHVAIAGPPGGGKSTGPEQYFIRKGQPFVQVNGDGGFRRRDMEGSVEVQNGRTFFRVAELAAAAVNGWGCILNEVNAADADALLYINGLLEVPFVVNIHGKSYPVHKDFRLVVTYNPGLVGTKPLPPAFKDRFFPIKLDFPPKAFIQKMIVAVTGIDASTAYLPRLLKYADDCWSLHVKGNLRYQISPRRLFDVVFLMETKAVDTVEDAIKQAVVDAVDSAADAQMLIKLITTPMKEVGPVAQFGAASNG